MKSGLFSLVESFVVNFVDKARDKARDKAWVATPGRPMRLILAIVMAAGCVALNRPVSAAPGPGDDDSEAADILDAPVSEKSVVEQFRKDAADAARLRQGAPLVDALQLLCRHKDVLIPADLMDTFTDALLTHGKPGDVLPFVPRLLKFQNSEALPPATARLNLGVKLALVFGGASFNDFKDLLTAQKADLEWVLPALGKYGGTEAVPLIQKYRDDAVIIPLGDEQNIRGVPCAAILAAAYAGDEAAREKILAFYDEDVEDLPRFAFYVSWGLQEGLNVVGAKRLVAFCQKRIQQAERLFDFVGPAYLPKLMARANESGSPAVTGYLIQSLRQAPPDQVRNYMGLLDHPTAIVRERVLDRLRESGDAALLSQATARARALLKSAAGTDRLFAVQALLSLDPAGGRKILDDALAQETNAAVRIRLEDLQAR